MVPTFRIGNDYCDFCFRECRCRLYSTLPRFGHVTSNVAECFQQLDRLYETRVSLAFDCFDYQKDHVSLCRTTKILLEDDIACSKTTTNENRSLSNYYLFFEGLNVLKCWYHLRTYFLRVWFYFVHLSLL
jgi:hypothetical protein